MLYSNQSQITILNFTHCEKVKEPFAPVPGDNVTVMKTSDDEKYLAVGTESGMIKIYKVYKYAQSQGEQGGGRATTEDGLHMHALWQTHLNKVTDICFIKNSVRKASGAEKKAEDKSLIEDYMIASVSYDRQFKLTSLKTETIIHRIDTNLYLK